MRSIKLSSIKFGAIPFRKLKDMELPIATRLTVIAGHNGVGKSTILGLLANGSGFSEKTYISYFNKTYQANFQEIFSLSPQHDFVEDPLKKPYVEIKYTIGNATVTKKCNITKSGEDTKRLRMRIVPRNEPKGIFTQGEVTVPADGKVPVPTIYLGISRTIPIGESDPAYVISNQDTKIVEEDAKYISEFINKLIYTGIDNNHAITDQSIKYTRKTSKHPQYAYDSKAVSLGQDTLSSIVTALVSFKKIKREMGEAYPGGILIIDEVDVGLHPRAQRDLIDYLKSEARKLSLQIIVTTHSLPLLEKIFDDRKSIPDHQEDRTDIVIYIQDTQNPQYRKDFTIDNIKHDMYLTLPPKNIKKKPIVKIYTEDDEAQFFLGKIFDRKTKNRITRETGVSIKIISFRTGCDELKGLYKKDDYFKSVVIVLDADSSLGRTGKQKNILKLPSDPNSSIKQSPESILYSFCKSLLEKKSDHPVSWKFLDKLNLSTDYIRANLLDMNVNINDRIQAKDWFKKCESHIEGLNLIKLWLAENNSETDQFINNLIKIIKRVNPKNIL